MSQIEYKSSFENIHKKAEWHKVEKECLMQTK